MAERTIFFQTDGTSALKIEAPAVAALKLSAAAGSAARRRATILPFPGAGLAAHGGVRKGAIPPLRRALDALKVRVTGILAASEMYCSLKFEDFRGCAYHLFTRRGIAALSAAVGAIAILSLAVSV